MYAIQQLVTLILRTQAQERRALLFRPCKINVDFLVLYQLMKVSELSFGKFLEIAEVLKLYSFRQGK